MLNILMLHKIAKLISIKLFYMLYKTPCKYEPSPIIPNHYFETYVEGIARKEFILQTQDKIRGYSEASYATCILIRIMF